jgi:glycosyltransferase involved in cell wall biosynthesis
VKVGVVANEVFDQRFGPMGGFGFAARAAARAFRDHEGHEVVYVLCRRTPDELGTSAEIDGVRIVLRPVSEGGLSYARRLLRERIDVLLTIDYRGSYRSPFRALPRTPIVVWVHDPRTPNDVAKVNSLEVPGVSSPAGIQFIDCTTIQEVMHSSARWRRTVRFGHNAQFLVERMEGTYGISGAHSEFLPTPLLTEEPPALVGGKSSRPSVVYLGRLDPIKRPWVALAVARAMPEIDLSFLGQSHFAEGGWAPEGDLPSNVSFVGHVDDQAKAAHLSAAWLLINTSIHEALPISFLEALSYGVPIVSCQDAGGITSNHGAYVGRWDGDGLSGVGAFQAAIRALVRAPATREAIGLAGQEMVHESYTKQSFIRAFEQIVASS